MNLSATDVQHAALWLIGPDVPGLLRLGAKFVADRGGNIDKDIADKFGEKAVVFMSITAKPADIKRMEAERGQLKVAPDMGVVFQAMKESTVPPGYQEDLYGFDIVTDDAPGLVAEITGLVADHGMFIVGHTGERRMAAGPRGKIQAGQKFILMLPHAFDHISFTHDLDALVKKYNGTMKTPLRTVPGLLWWW